MQRVQMYKLVIVMGVSIFASSACGQEKVPTVNDYVHDIDKARAVTKEGKTAHEAEAARLASNPGAMAKFINTESPITNASKALRVIYTAYELGKPLRKCFGSKSFTTASTAKTDHVCVDAAGFKR